MSVIQVDRILAAAIAKNASDIHFEVGKTPILRVDGRLEELPTAVLDAEATAAAMKAIVPDKEQAQVQEKGSADFAFNFEPQNGKGARFRGNVYRAQGRIGMALRRLPNLLLLPEQLGLPSAIVGLTARPRGLILVTGPTGSGKTTTLAALINHIAKTSARHVITIEEPTEYRLEHGRSIVTQREVPNDVPTFREGLRDALREDPDVIMVGEMRDLETTRVAVSAAETGHLVLSTLHTVSAAKTIDRLIDQFPDSEQAQIRSQVSTSLLAVMCQQLLKRKDGKGRVAAFELLIVTMGVANLIRERKIEQVESTMKTQARMGMQLLDDDLFGLWQRGLVEAPEAVSKANRPAELDTRIRQASM